MRVILLLLLTPGLALVSWAQEPGNPVGEGEAMIEIDLDGAALYFIEANVYSTHAWQVLLRMKTGKGDPKAFDPIGYTAEQLEGFARSHRERLAQDPKVLGPTLRKGSSRVWGSDVPAALKLREDLPVRVAGRVLREKYAGANRVGAAGLANLLQIVLEVDRDGDILQDTLKLYTALGWKVAPTDFGIPDDDQAFLALGEALSPGCCAAPYDTSPAAWQIGLRKIQNWTVKYRGGVKAADYAREVLARPEIKALAPKLEAMPGQRILVIGHSFTSDEHWSSAFSFVGIVGEVFAELNPKVTVKRVGEGGMTVSRARDRFLAEALRDKPDRVIIVAVSSKDEDYAALEEMTRKLTDGGAQVIFFDQIYTVERSWINPDPARLKEAARRSGLVILEVGKQTMAHPQVKEFVCLDGTHMRPPYHKFLAGEVLKFLAGARGAQSPLG